MLLVFLGGAMAGVALMTLVMGVFIAGVVAGSKNDK